MDKQHELSAKLPRIKDLQAKASKLAIDMRVFLDMYLDGIIVDDTLRAVYEDHLRTSSENIAYTMYMTNKMQGLSDFEAQEEAFLIIATSIVNSLMTTSEKNHERIEQMEAQLNELRTNQG